MALFNFRKLLSRKTKKNKVTRSNSKKGKKTVNKSKTAKRSRASSRNGKKTQRIRRIGSRGGKKTQRGAGGNYRLDVAKNCKIGGLPVVSPVNECPKGVGPADLTFGTAIYTNPVVGGGNIKKTMHSRRK